MTLQLLTDMPESDLESNRRVELTLPSGKHAAALYAFPIPPGVTSEYWDRRLCQVLKTWGKYTEKNNSTHPDDKAKATELVNDGLFYKEALKKIRQDLYTASDMCKFKFGNGYKAGWDLSRIGRMTNGRDHVPSLRYRGFIKTIPK